MREQLSSLGLEQGDEQGPLGREVVVEHRPRYPGVRRDAPERGALVAVGRELLQRSVDDQGAAGGGGDASLGGRGGDLCMITDRGVS